MAFGLIEGAAEMAAILARLVSGFLSDRLARSMAPRGPAIAASVLAGWLWRHYSPATHFYVSAALASLAALLLLFA